MRAMSLKALQARLTRRVALLLFAFGFLTFGLVACAVGPSAQNLQGTSFQFATPNPLLYTPTPTFPPFTVGAWPSNYAPNNADTVTIYVLCRAQNAAMTGPSTPVQGLPVSVTASAPVNQNGSGTTDADGMAAIPLTFTDPQSGTPVTVSVTVNYHNQTYTASTFFTPSPMATPTPTPKPGAPATPTGKPTATP